MSNVLNLLINRGSVDLTSCDLEAVHLIATVQSHGALLSFDSKSGQLLEASSNWTSFLSPTEEDSLDSLFSPEIAKALQAVESERAIVLSQTLAQGIEISAHRTSKRLLVELERTESALPFDPILGLTGVMHSLTSAATSEMYLSKLANELRAALEIDRIMIYRFLPDWTGEVAAEACQGTSLYLGLRFPASDIPQPARRIFEQVWVRHIADAEEPAVPVHAGSALADELDLTQVGIRAASPIHLQYLANMGVGASLTLSLRVGDRLWGLVAGHHGGSFLLKPSARASLEILAQMASLQLSALLRAETRDQRQQSETVLAVVEERLEVNEDARLSNCFDELEGYLHADMLAIYENGRWTRRGGVALEALEAFLAWLEAENPQNEVLFSRDCLPTTLVPGYAGVMVVASTSQSQGRKTCWFRREQSHSVRWAGDPRKDSTMMPLTRLQPRASFAEYVETTQGRSLPWTELDLWKAERFAQLLRTLSLRWHRRLEQKAEALARSNRELDSFAYMASHDLKEPLRGIHNYATFLKEDYGALLEGEGLVFLDGLTDLTQKMSNLVDALLAYCRLEGQVLEINDCDLAPMARDICHLLKVTRKAETQVVEPLPIVQAYAPFLSEILVNLLTNAIKYSDDKNRKVEIGALPSRDGLDIFYVKDNGIGIPAEFHEEIFELFRRLNGEESDGAGVGLTIVKKMVDRHGGKVWVESEPGQGSTFFVALPRLSQSSQRAG